MTKWFFFYQMEEEGDNRPWTLEMADQRERIVRDKRPPFTTILDVDHSFEDDLDPGEVNKVSYRGPFYIDMDCPDPEDVCNQFKKLLRNLQKEYEVDLSQVGLFLSGGRGFHLTFPQAMFMQSPPARGTPMLPWIYKEMANHKTIFVDTVDMAIYSTKRGRMFRTPNVRRANGNFKVPISVDEALNMTVEMYKRLVTDTRHVEVKPATYNPNLGRLYATMEDRVNKAIKSQKDRAKDARILERYKDTVPPTLAAVMRGERIKEDMGFQEIAMQLAIVANAAGWELEFFLDQCDGLIEKHVSDGNRYNTPAKRIYELSRMYHYMQGNPGYNFSIGGLKSIMEKGADVTDLEMAPEPEEEEEEDGQQKTKALRNSLTHGVRVNENGIFRKTEEGTQQVSAMGLAHPRQLLELDTGEVHGYEVDVYVNGVQKKPKIISMDAFKSRAAFIGFTYNAAGCSVSLTDMQIGAIADIMRHQAEQDRPARVHSPEGRHRCCTAPRFGDGEYDVIWADQFGVVSTQDPPINYRLTGSMTDDLSIPHRSPSMLLQLDDSDTGQRVLQASCSTINTVSKSVARFLGYLLGGIPLPADPAPVPSVSRDASVRPGRIRQVADHAAVRQHALFPNRT
jgi:hypothetical protein